MEFKLISVKHGVEIATIITGDDYRSLFAIFYDGHIFAVDLLFIHLITIRK